jgi:uncharacterized protein YegJ (DUF2314 family)
MINHQRIHLAALAAILGLAHVVALAKPKAAPAPKKDDEVVDIQASDPDMKAAFKKAQSTLDEFLAAVRGKDKQFQNIALRIVLHQGKKTEYIWVTPFTETAKGFSGTVNNLPTVITNLQLGQQIVFGRKDVVDWMYVDPVAKVMHGNFTTCALLRKGPPDDAKEMKKRYGLDCAK